MCWARLWRMMMNHVQCLHRGADRRDCGIRLPMDTTASLSMYIYIFFIENNWLVARQCRDGYQKYIMRLSINRTKKARDGHLVPAGVIRVNLLRSLNKRARALPTHAWLLSHQMRVLFFFFRSNWVTHTVTHWCARWNNSEWQIWCMDHA